MICEQCGSDMEEESTIYRRFFKCYECEWEYEYYYDQESRSIYHNRKPAFRHNQLPGVKNDNHFTSENYYEKEEDTPRKHLLSPGMILWANVDGGLTTKEPIPTNHNFSLMQETSSDSTWAQVQYNGYSSYDNNNSPVYIVDIPDKKPYYHNNMKGDLFNDDYNDM